MQTLTTELPSRLETEVKKQIKAGWFANENELILEALRRYLETHPADLAEHFVREDIEWGLAGDD